MGKRVFLAEDDPFQARSIAAAIRTYCGAAVTVANSESEARNKVTAADGSPEEPFFDIYIVDLMLPWARGDDIPEPDDPRVLTQGPLRAGFRVIEAIQRREAELRPNFAPDILLYTVAADDAEPPSSPPPGSYHRYLKQDDDNREIAAVVAQLLREHGIERR